MPEPILLDRFRNDAYNQNQIINDKLDFLIGEMRDMKQDIRALDKKIENVRTELKSDINKLDEKIENVRTELKSDINKLDEKIDNVRTESKSDINKLDEKIDNVRTDLKTEIDKNHAELKNEINTARWQIVGVVVAQICFVGAIVWAVVSAVK